MFVPTIGLESAHEESNNNGQRVISFTSSRSLIVAPLFLTRTNILGSLQMDGL